MRLRPRVSLFSAVLMVLASAGFVVACSKQGEGERCSTSNNNDDCQSGLVCKEKLNVCCPDAIADATTEVCKNGNTTVTDSGATETSSETGDDTGADTGADTATTPTDGGLGATCLFNSDCVEPYLCDRSGHCNFQCAGDRDCASGQHCWSDKSCHDTVEPTDSGTDTTPPADTASADTAEAG